MAGALTHMLGNGKSPVGASVSITPGSVNANLQFNNSYAGSATATAVGITSPTYLWSWLSGGTGITLTSTTSATVNITSGPYSTNRENTGELQWVVSGTGGPKTSSIPVDLLWGLA